MRLRITNSVACSPLAMFQELKALLSGDAPTIATILSKTGVVVPDAVGVANNIFWWRSGNGAHLVFGVLAGNVMTHTGGEHRSFNPAAPTEPPEPVFTANIVSFVAAVSAQSIVIDFVYRPDYSGIAYTVGSNKGGFLALNKPDSVLATPLGRTQLAATSMPAATGKAAWLYSYDCTPGNGSPSFTETPACMAIGSQYGLYDGLSFTRRPIQVGSCFLGEVNDLGAEVFVQYASCGYADEFTLNGELYRGFAPGTWNYGFVLKEEE